MGDNVSTAYDASFVVSSGDLTTPSAEASPTSSSVLADSPSSTGSASLDVHHLVTTYLEAMSTIGDSNGDGHYDGSHGTGELAYNLDSVITNFIDNYSLSTSDYAHIHQSVMEHIARDLNDLMPGTDHDIAFDSHGHVVDDASVLVALDQHFQDLLDHHNSMADSAYHDILPSDHSTV